MPVTISLEFMDRIDRIGNIFGFTGGSFAGMVYGTSGCAPALNTMGGGRREPLILVYEDDDCLDSDSDRIMK